MNIFLFGDCHSNSGPSNVNKEIIRNSNDKISYMKKNNKFLKIFELIYKFTISKVIIFSGYGKYNLLMSKLSNIFNKKTIYIMHGCIKYENEINNLKIEKKTIENEIKFIKNVKLVLCVSENYSKWVKNYYKLDNGISFLNNGTPIMPNLKKVKKKNNKEIYKIVLIGGNRNIKNNKIVCDVIDELIDDGYRIELKIFGRVYVDNENIISKNALKSGMVPHEKLCEELENSNLYISKSIVESFNLSVFDALYSGCDILLSKNVGALSVIETNNHDIINDCMDRKEIKEKIIYIMKHSNCERIIDSISEESNWENSTLKLLEYCKNMMGKCHEKNNK